MAARKPSPPKKKAAPAKKAAPKPSVLGNDPFARGSAVREVSAQAPAAPLAREARPVTPEFVQGSSTLRGGAVPVPAGPSARPVTPELQGPARPVVRRPVLEQINEKPKSGSGMPQPPPRFVPPAPSATPVRPRPRADPNKAIRPPAASPRVIVDTSPSANAPTFHSASPALSADPRSPSPQPPRAPISHAASPSTVDPRPHAGAPAQRILSGDPTAHAASPSLSFDPRPHEGTPTAQTLSGAISHAASPSVCDEPRQHAGTPTAQTLSGPTAHAASPSLTVDPRPHAASPTAQTLNGPTAHAASPSLTVDPRPHAASPTAQTLNGPTAHAASPSLAFDPRPHAGTPTAQTIMGPTAHAASPSLAFDPRPHAGTPTAQTIMGPTAHAASPSVAFDPRPHAGAPTAQRLSGPTPHASSPFLTGEPGPHAASGSASDAAVSTGRGQTRRALAPAEAAPPRLASPTIAGAVKGLFNAARASAGLASRTTEVDRWGKDAALASSLRPLGELLYEKYWRVRVEGAEHLPTGPCIIVANHAGALPLDGPVLHLALRRERPELEESRWLLEDQIFHAPFVGVLANRLGAVRASPENAMRLLEENRPLIVFPEGFHGLSKPFSERYQLKRFGRGGYVKIALRAKVPIVPVAIIGGEESMPLLGKIPGGLFGVQYLPITLPPLPARWHLRFAAPVSLEGAPPEPERDLAWVERTNLGVRDQIEGMLTDMLQHRERIF